MMTLNEDYFDDIEINDDIIDDKNDDIISIDAINEYNSTHYE